MDKEAFKSEKPVRKVAILILAFIGVCVLFGVLLFSASWFGDLLNPFIGDFSYLAGLIITIAAANFICCKIVKPVCEVKFRGKNKGEK